MAVDISIRKEEYAMKRVLAFVLAVILVLSTAGCVTTGEDTTAPKNPGSTNAPGNTTGPGSTSDPTGNGTTDAPTDPTGSPSAPSQGAEPHVHVYGDWVTTKAPSCTETGTRSCNCECGDTKTEEIPKTDHDYVNGVCTGCGKQNYAGTLRILDNLDVDELYWCSDDVIVYKKNDCYYMADHNGKVLTPGYNYGIKCANSDGYVVAYNCTTENLGTVTEEDITMDVIRTTIDCYVLDRNGNVVFSTQFIKETRPYVDTFSGEYIDSCNEDRIITYTSDRAPWGLQYVLKTVYFYDIQGNRLATFEGVNSVGTMIGGVLALTAVSDGTRPGGILVTDKNGKILRSSSDVYSYAYLSGGWTMAGFIGDYIFLSDEGVYQLVSKDLSKVHQFSADYTDVIQHYGTIFVTKIEIDGQISDDYYLVDAANCTVDSSGYYIIPTLDAAITKQGYSYVTFSHIFGNDAPYALVSRDGKWGYLSLDGKTEKLYDDAGRFMDGLGIVKDGENIYVIDKDFNQISNAITGYDSVAGNAGGVFQLTKDGKITVAVYS